MAISLDKTTCPNCGNTLTFNPETQSLSCDLCSQVSDIQEDYIGDMAYNIIPFQVSQQQIKKLFLQWLVKRNADTPFDMIENIRIDLIRGQYFPAWVLPVYHKPTNKYFDAICYAGYDSITVEPIVKVIDNTVIQSELLKPYEAKYTMGFDVVATPLMDKKATWRKYLRNKEGEAFKYYLEEGIKFCYVPVWVVKYTYQYEEYAVFVDGVNGKQIKGNVAKEPFILARHSLSKKLKISIYTCVIALLCIMPLVLAESDEVILGAMMIAFLVVCLIAAVSALVILYCVFMLLFIKSKTNEKKRRQKMKDELAKYLAKNV